MSASNTCDSLPTSDPTSSEMSEMCSNAAPYLALPSTQSSTFAMETEMSGVVAEEGWINEIETPSSSEPPLEPQGYVKPRIHPGRLSRHQLPLYMKIEVIRLHEEKGLGIRTITEVMNMHGFKCGKTQVRNILLRKQEWIEQYAQNAPLDRKRKLRRTGYEEVNKKVYKWFEGRLEAMLPVSGHMIQAKAVEIARELGFNNFTASNGWLESFRKRHSITFGKGDGVDRQLAAAQAETVKISDGSLENYLKSRKKRKIKQNARTRPDTGREIISKQSQGQNKALKIRILKAGGKSRLEDRKTGGSAVAGRKDEQSYRITVKEEIQSEEEMGEEQVQSESGQEAVPTMLTSIHDVAAALKDIRMYFIHNGYTNLIEGCTDLEVCVARECSREEAPKRSTVLDHLNPFDTRPTSQD